MRTISKVLIAAAAVFALSLPARAQFIGFTSPQTISAKPFTNASCTGSDQLANVPDNGQTAHNAFLQGSGISFLQLKLQGSHDGATFFDISEEATTQGNQQAAVTGAGWFPVVRVVVNCNVGGTFSVSYTGQAVTEGPLYGNFLTSQYVKNVALGQPAGVNFSSESMRLPFGNTAGTLFFRYNSASVAGSSITVTCGDTSTLTPSYIAATFPGVANVTSTLQAFTVSANACPYMSVTYNSGGATGGNFDLDYVFTLPGTPTSETAKQGANVTTTTATAVKATRGFLHTLTINTGAAGTITVFDLAGASCTGTPATNQRATITATATMAPTTLSYDFAFANGICVKASVAMDYTVSFQ